MKLGTIFLLILISSAAPPAFGQAADVAAGSSGLMGRRIAHVVEAAPELPAPVARIARESVAIHLEAAGADLTPVDPAELPDDPERQLREAQGRGFDLALVTELAEEGRMLSYRFSLFELEGGRRIAARRGRTPIDFNMDAALSTAITDLLADMPAEPGGAARPRGEASTDSAEAQHGEEQEAESAARQTVTPREVTPQEPARAAAVHLSGGFTALVPVARAADYFEPLLGGAGFVGYSFASAPLSLGVMGAGVYASAGGAAVTAGSMLAPFGLELRLHIGVPPVTAAPRIAAGAALIRLNAEPVGLFTKPAPAVDGGVLVMIHIARRLRLDIDIAYTAILESSLPITGIRSGIGLHFESD